MEAHTKTQAFLQESVQAFLKSAPNFVKLRKGATDETKALVSEVVKTLHKLAAPRDPLPVNQLECLRDLAKAVDDAETHTSICEVLLEVSEESAAQSLTAALGGDLTDRQQMCNLLAAVQQVKNLTKEAGVLTESRRGLAAALRCHSCAVRLRAGLHRFHRSVARRARTFVERRCRGGFLEGRPFNVEDFSQQSDASRPHHCSREIRVPRVQCSTAAGR